MSEEKRGEHSDERRLLKARARLAGAGQVRYVYACIALATLIVAGSIGFHALLRPYYVQSTDPLVELTLGIYQVRLSSDEKSLQVWAGATAVGATAELPQDPLGLRRLPEFRGILTEVTRAVEEWSHQT